MTSTADLFTRLSADLARRLSSPRTAASAAAWAAEEPALAGITRAVDAVTRCADRNDAVASRAALTALLRLAGAEPLAADAALAAVVPALRSVAGRLCRVWRQEPAEIDQAVAAAGWERIVVLAGSSVEWPDRVIAGAARDAVRAQLRAASRRPTDPFPDDDGGGGGRGGGVPIPAADSGHWGAEARDLFRCAVADGVVSPASAGVVWEVRAFGTPAVVVAARTGRQPAAIRKQCRRAERALRAHLEGGLAGLPAAS
ncbi:MAG: hypothetical protein M0Z30_10770 [Actinomycetota bacterium]|nr:hypothetical protein [Actinomycetota bacterium]